MFSENKFLGSPLLKKLSSKGRPWGNQIHTRGTFICISKQTTKNTHIKESWPYRVGGGGSKYIWIWLNCSKTMQLENTSGTPCSHRVFYIPQEKLKPSKTMYPEDSGSTRGGGGEEEGGHFFHYPKFSSLTFFILYCAV